RGGFGHRRLRASHYLDLRFERRARKDQRGLQDMSSFQLPVASSQLQAEDFLSVLDFDPAELEACLTLSERLKRQRSLGQKAPTSNALKGAHVALLFDKH